MAASWGTTDTTSWYDYYMFTTHYPDDLIDGAGIWPPATSLTWESKCGVISCVMRYATNEIFGAIAGDLDHNGSSESAPDFWWTTVPTQAGLCNGTAVAGSSAIRGPGVDDNCQSQIIINDSKEP